MKENQFYLKIKDYNEKKSKRKHYELVIKEYNNYVKYGNTNLLTKEFQYWINIHKKIKRMIHEKDKVNLLNYIQLSRIRCKMNLFTMFYVYYYCDDYENCKNILNIIPFTSYDMYFINFLQKNDTTEILDENIRSIIDQIDTNNN